MIKKFNLHKRGRILSPLVLLFLLKTDKNKYKLNKVVSKITTRIINIPVKLSLKRVIKKETSPKKKD